MRRAPLPCLLLLLVRGASSYVPRCSPTTMARPLVTPRAVSNCGVAPLTKPQVPNRTPAFGSARSYAAYWEDLLQREHRETADQLRKRRSKWSQSRLEASGLGIFDASASPETDLFGEKIVRVSKQGETRLADRFSRGDILVLSPDRFSPSWPSAASSFAPRECCVVDAGKDWITVGVGRSWPAGLWEARRHPGSFGVTLERAAPQAALKAQRESLALAASGVAGPAAALLTSDHASLSEAAAAIPPRLVMPAAPSSMSETSVVSPKVDAAIYEAIAEAKREAKFVPNESQEEAIAWALRRRLSLIRGPPGTGKTRTAALLISSALRVRDLQPDGPSSPPPRVLAVAHSNGAADVLLAALLRMGVPAVRAGRPASVSPNVRRRTVIALAERHPEVVGLRARALNASLPPHDRSAASMQLRSAREEICNVILHGARVVVASCVGAHQLLSENMTFPLCVLDEGSQATEPALICALAAAKAEQLVVVGDTRQLPPTVASGSAELRQSLGRSPMARLEHAGLGQRTLRVQYRMPAELLEHPSRYFYDSLVECARNRPRSQPPGGFAWPGGRPLCFVHCGSNLEVSHHSGGKSNPREAAVVAKIVSDVLEAGDVAPANVAVIAPYSSQVDQVRTRLGRLGRTCRVGTVDSFQGQETDLVIVSATRSNDLGDLGFLNDPRRLCVAITRARRGLIVVGDTQTLRHSHHWAALVDSCKARDCFLELDSILHLDSAPAPLAPAAALSVL